MTRDDAHDPRAIANKILELCDREGRPLTIMKLIKLAYLADGWSMALRGTPLASQDPQAWQYGPVYPPIYSAFKRFGASKITAPATIFGTDAPYCEEFTSEEEALIKQVIESYGKFHPFQLSEIMHRAGTPWDQTIKSQGQYAEIPASVMAEHFKALAKQRGIALAH
jgi:uncharacterized phage-associated protein